MTESLAQGEVDRNYAEFRRMLPELLKAVPGKYVVMHAGSISDTFDTFGDAIKFGYAKFGKNQFSVQEVTTENISLGSYSHALYSHSD